MPIDTGSGWDNCASYRIRDEFWIAEPMVVGRRRWPGGWCVRLVDRFREVAMSFKQLLVGIMVGVTSCLLFPFAPAVASDKDEAKAEKVEAARVGKEKAQKPARTPSPWDTRPMVPAGPKY